MNDYGRDRYLPPTPAEDAARERAQILDARADALAQALFETQSDCPVTGVTLGDVTGSLDDYDAFDTLVFACAGGNSAAPIMLKAQLARTAKKLILEQLERTEELRGAA